MQTGGVALFAPYCRANSKASDDRYRAAVFELLHEPPAVYSINRTSWKADDLLRVLTGKGLPLSRQTLSQIVRAAGYKWRQARVALTSTDPLYREKLDHVQNILGQLTEHDAFFSIDEYGPFAVKMKPGRMLTAPGEQRIVPQFQKSEGCMIMTAALELQSNKSRTFTAVRRTLLK